ncbi:MAG: dihydrolipoyl dehydrogenase [Nitrospirae bacterium]|nr:dihydrolipoyl dehydrogenase [Nitrospirota bacterium]MBI3352179.1 dihydrolipoyl dehydrogenase [Nitrospirota bacterium]
MTKRFFDLVVIGAGSGGFAAARAAAAIGKTVALIDQGPFGGLCILKGCMPSKTLIRSSELAFLARNSTELGIQVKGLAVDPKQIVSRKNKIIAGFADYRFQEMRSNPRITFIDGFARFQTPDEVQIGRELVRGGKIVIATGSKIRVPSLEGLNETGFITSDEALELTDLPKSLAIIGAGTIAMELGQYFARMGAEVSILARGDSPLSWEDDEVGRTLERYFQEEGIHVYPRVKFERVARAGDLKQVEITVNEKPVRIEVEEILVATGRYTNFEGLNLDVTDVACNAQGIVVNDEMETNVPSIFAVGDATGIFQLAHIAVYQGEIAGHNAFSNQKIKTDYRIVPEVIFTDPIFARVGLTEKEAQKEGRPVLTASYPFDDLGKAICTGQTKGFVKMIADRSTGEILGVEVLGAEADLLIHEMVVAMHFRATAQQLARIPHFHPTLSEIFTYPAEKIAVKFPVI